jgi:hypothetical protein
MENGVASALRDMRVEREAHALAILADRAVTAKVLCHGHAAMLRSRELIAWFARADRERLTS